MIGRAVSEAFIDLNVSCSKHEIVHSIVEVYKARPQPYDLKLPRAPSGQGVTGEARSERMVFAYLKPSVLFRVLLLFCLKVWNLSTISPI
ncbi:hypothetical protein PoB_006658900 [Plakobranchus ocellatus]|uniref:Uncharacterized protein n=1 Tax=Plakobranchus ocellatus TaxID=259542 RepID=A0AAV4D7A9_9GAST|nr:hypothetical protein PoB_006658900 [Plakobranchus ocellatus]